MRKILIAVVVVLLGGAAGGYWWWQGHHVPPAVVSAEMKDVRTAARNFPQNTGAFGVWQASITVEESLDVMTAVHQFLMQPQFAKSGIQSTLIDIAAMLTDPKVMTPDTMRDLLPKSSALGVYTTTQDSIGDVLVSHMMASPPKTPAFALPVRFYGIVTVADGPRAEKALGAMVQKVVASHPGMALTDVSYRDHILHVLTFPGTGVAAAWTIEKNTILSGTQASVQDAIDRMATPDAGLAGNVVFNQALSELHGQGPTFFVDLRMKEGEWAETISKSMRGLVSEFLPVWNYWAGVFPAQAGVVGESVLRMSDHASRILRRNVFNSDYNIALGAASVIPKHMDYVVSLNWRMPSGLVDMLLEKAPEFAKDDQRKKWGLDQKNLESIFDGEVAVGFVYPDLSKSMSMMGEKAVMAPHLPSFEVAVAAKVRDFAGFQRQIGQWTKLEDSAWGKQEVDGTTVYQSPFCSYARLGDYVVVVPNLSMFTGASDKKEPAITTLIKAHAQGETLSHLSGFEQTHQALGGAPAVAMVFISGNYYKKFFDGMIKMPGLTPLTQEILTGSKAWWSGNHLNDVVIDDTGMRSRYVRSAAQ